MEIKGNRVVKWASLSLDPDIFEEEVVVDPKALGTAIKQLMASSGIKSRQVAASVTSLYSLCRIIIAPVPLGEVIAESVVLDSARDILPLPEEELYIFWQSIGIGSGGNQIFLLAIPRDIIDSEMLSFKSTGLTCRNLDFKTLALARVVNSDRALIVNIDENNLDVIIIIDGIIEISHSNSWHLDSTSRDDIVEHLASSVNLVIDYYNSNRPGETLSPGVELFVTGSLSDDEELVDRLGETLGHLRGDIEPPLEYPPHLPVSQYAVNIGLALKSINSSGKAENVHYSPPNINLLPGIYKPWKPSRRQMYTSLAVLASIAMLFPFYEVTIEEMSVTNDLNRQFNSYNNLLDIYKQKLAERDPLISELNSYENILALGGGLTDDLNLIDSIASEFNVTYNTITHDGETISFYCEAESYIIFRDFISSIENSERFTSLSSPPEGYPYLRSGTLTLKTVSE